MGITRASIRTPAAGIWGRNSRGWTSLKAHQGIAGSGPSSFTWQLLQIGICWLPQGDGGLAAAAAVPLGQAAGSLLHRPLGTLHLCFSHETSSSVTIGVNLFVPGMGLGLGCASWCVAGRQRVWGRLRALEPAPSTPASQVTLGESVDAERMGGESRGIGGEGYGNPWDW